MSNDYSNFDLLIEINKTILDFNYCSLAKERPHPTIGSIKFLYLVKVYSNERPPWSKLCVANGVYLWSLRSIAPSAMHV